MNNILFIGNGFDIDHCIKIQDLKNISTYESLKNEVRNKNLYIYNLINDTKELSDDWSNLEKTKYYLNLEKSEIKEFLTIVKCWAKKIDIKYEENKDTLFNVNFQKFIDSKNLLILSLNYTKLISLVYNVKNKKVLNLHDFEELAYLDSNDNYAIGERNEAKLGLPTIEDIPEASKQAIGICTLRNQLKNYLSKDIKKINIYLYGSSLDGVDFRYFEELFKHNTSKNINSFNVYIKKHNEVGKDRTKIKLSIEKFFTYQSLQNNGLVYLMMKELKLYSDENNDKNWVILKYKLKDKKFIELIH